MSFTNRRRKSYYQRRRIQRQERRIMNLIRIQINNNDTLRRIENLPPQNTNDSFANQLFNGLHSFY